MKREMIYPANLRLLNPSGGLILPLALLTTWALTGAFPGLAQQLAQPTFPSVADATQSLFQAVQSSNEQAIANILGGPTELTSSLDAGQDKLEREMFVHKYQEMHRLRRETDGSTTLYIGAENWPFPIPIVEKNGAWRFDPDAGMKEVLYRRIGENELTAIAVCHAVIAKRQDDAQANIETPDDEVATVVRAVRRSAAGAPLLIHGYYFRRLPVQSKGVTHQGSGALALIAYPAEYRSSGVMTFIVTDGDVIYEKDLGANTAALAPAIAAFHKDATWHRTNE
jgi:hypothetical protein